MKLAHASECQPPSECETIPRKPSFHSPNHALPFRLHTTYLPTCHRHPPHQEIHNTFHHHDDHTSHQSPSPIPRFPKRAKHPPPCITNGLHRANTVTIAAQPSPAQPATLACPSTCIHHREWPPTHVLRIPFAGATNLLLLSYLVFLIPPRRLAKPNRTLPGISTPLSPQASSRVTHHLPLISTGKEIILPPGKCASTCTRSFPPTPILFLIPSPRPTLYPHPLAPPHPPPTSFPFHISTPHPSTARRWTAL